MSIDSIFLFAPAEAIEAGRGPATYAVGMAQALSARLTILVVNLDVTTPGRQADAVAAAETLRSDAAAKQVDCVVLTEHSHAIGIHEVVSEHARLHDLTIIGCRGDGLLTERDVVEHLLFDSGRPVLIVPAAHQLPFSASRAVAAWDNTRAAARALADAKPLIGDREAVLLTIEGDKPLAGDLTREELTATLARRGLNVRAVQAQRGDRTIADALQDEATALGADLLVMGGYGHSRLRRVILGSATSGMFACPRLPVLLSH